MSSQRKAAVTSGPTDRVEEERLAAAFKENEDAEIAINERLADILWAYVKREKIGVEMFADILGISRATAYKLAGRSIDPKKRASPSLSTLRQFVKKTGVSAD